MLWMSKGESLPLLTIASKYDHHMAVIAGIDGCPSAWFAILLDTETKSTKFEIVNDLSDFYGEHKPIVVAIDIPIGLTDSGPRKCDLEARKILKGRSSCVFPAPIRPALNGSDRTTAHSISVSVHGKGVPAQAFGIYPKILEVDTLMTETPKLQNVLFEVHPELSFFAWNSDQVIQHPKKTILGASHRLALAQEAFGQDAFEKPRSMFRRSKVANDDILDAYAALWTAGRILKGEAKHCPAEEIRDSHGIRMTMWF